MGFETVIIFLLVVFIMGLLVGVSINRPGTPW